ncbi:MULTISPECIES: accessory factor UbiK family protein [Oligella]|uniref:Ubiquinone biosynthesis accessory factor UbiK n=2 Tax=Oligella urethralis TaxID=90245 RepID=A0A096BGX2_9BURK|nr:MULTISPECIES: accessory factor UbiK family protein [Oligella]AVL71078.1 phosphoheptose isomerase [Oligella urethralis]KGF32364.1 phosphoheptose isomerase [Oligella urethralis DNF00040]OFS84737.1 phosphoheptose isomerase [Oligella sp. HMSC05A10]OFV47823.1 phosphoheptose isomerase [Oligella sp. HMSC09E12]PMC17937.1 phosphoheptose isomerase [Oligella urethralis]
MKAQSFFEEFQKGIQDLIAKSPAADIEKNVKAFMAQGFSRLDLVTREEFDVQVAMVEKLRQRITALEALLAERDQHENKTSPTED